MSESIAVLAEPAGADAPVGLGRAARPGDAPDEDVTDELVLADELLVEEISIDGMCGVY